MTTVFDLVSDRYERKARATPGLLVALPLLVPLVAVHGPQHPILTGVLGLVGGCGAIFALANVARGRGKKLEEHLIAKWGGMPTTIALRHRDSFLDGVSKQRYHAAIEAKLGIAMPTPEEEFENPGKADEVYIGATRRLRELTRSDKQLLLKENIAYGFHRNMLAMKAAGILSCLLGLVYALLIANVLHVSPPYFALANLVDPGLAAGLTLLVSISLLATWLLYFDQDAVKRVGFAYAERLLEHLPSLP